MNAHDEEAPPPGCNDSTNSNSHSPREAEEDVENAIERVRMSREESGVTNEKIDQVLNSYDKI